MGASRNKPKRCETCAFYTPGDLKGQGWCMHPKRQQTGGMLLLVRARALDCRNSWGEDYWTPQGATLSPVPPVSPPATDATAAHAPGADDLVIQQATPTRNDGAAMTNASKIAHDDDESINHAALSDQEDRAHVMARGAREAILRARERKKERTVRQPRVTAMPTADMEAGDWSDFDDAGDAVTDDTVLGVRHQPAVDPFRRSYNDPAPPVPSRELPPARGIVSSAHDDRFDSVPQVREDIVLPRPAHLAGEPMRSAAQQGVDDHAADLPDNPALSSYDRVLQRARRLQRLSSTRGPQRVIRPSPASTSPLTVSESTHFAENRSDSSHEEKTADQHTAETQPPDVWREEPRDDAAESRRWVEPFEDEPDDLTLEPGVDVDGAWDDDENPFPEDDDAPWLVASSMTTGDRPPARARFRLPQLSFWRHGHHERELRQRVGSFVMEEDEVVAHSISTANGPGAFPPEPVFEDDPDWADDAVPIETYAAEQTAPIPADVVASDQDAVAWDAAWTDEDWAEDEQWADTEEEAAPEFADDFVTAEATVPHRAQPAPATFDMDNLRDRLFARAHVNERAAEQSEPLPALLTRDDRVRALAPDDDPDPDPGTGSGFEAPAPIASEPWSEPAAEQGFDVREVVRRQAELLDMRIQVAPDVPRECRTCRYFRPAEGGERGWCTNDWAFSHRRMVNADDLPCESSIGCWWLPSDDVWLPEDDLTALTQPTPLIDRLLGRLRQPRDDDEEEPLRARAR